MDTSTFQTKVGLAEMLKGGVIMDVVNAEQARIAEDAGACAVMALERVPAQIRKDGGVARASDPAMIKSIQEAVSIPVMAKCRIGHFVEARILEALEVDFIDESEVLTPADDDFHIRKDDFKIPFVCGCTNLGEAFDASARAPRCYAPRAKRVPVTSSRVCATSHGSRAHRALTRMPPEELMTEAKEIAHL